MFLKLGMKHQGEELYKVCINHDLGMTLTYFMARSAEVAYPRSQVSVYRTIGPLVNFYEGGLGSSVLYYDKHDILLNYTLLERATVLLYNGIKPMPKRNK